MSSKIFFKAVLLSCFLVVALLLIKSGSLFVSADFSETMPDGDCYRGAVTTVTGQDGQTLYEFTPDNEGGPCVVRDATQASGVCQQGHCVSSGDYVPPPGEEDHGDVGTDCSEDSECLPGICDNGTCVCLSKGEACDQDKECCNWLCLGGSCGCKEVGEGCWEDLHCCGGLACKPGVGSEGTCVYFEPEERPFDENCVESFEWLGTEGRWAYTPKTAGTECQTELGEAAICDGEGKCDPTLSVEEYNADCNRVDPETQELVREPKDKACSTLDGQLGLCDGAGNCVPGAGGYNDDCVGIVRHYTTGREEVIFYGPEKACLTASGQQGSCDGAGNCVPATGGDEGCNENGMACYNDASCCSGVCVSNICTSCFERCSFLGFQDSMCFSSRIFPSHFCSFYNRCATDIVSEGAKYCSNSSDSCYCYDLDTTICTPDCQKRCTNTGCTPLSPEQCCDDIDNDGDGQKDGLDSDCGASASTVQLSAGVNSNACWRKPWNGSDFDKRYTSRMFKCPEGYYPKVNVSYALRSYEDLYIMGEAGNHLRNFCGADAGNNSAVELRGANQIYFVFYSGSESSQNSEEDSRELSGISLNNYGVNAHSIECVEDLPRCSDCGDGITNICDATECRSLGDCVFKRYLGIYPQCLDAVYAKFTVIEKELDTAVPDVLVKAVEPKDFSKVIGSCTTDENGACHIILALGEQYSVFVDDNDYECERGICAVSFTPTPDYKERILEAKKLSKNCFDSDYGNVCEAGETFYKGSVYSDQCRDNRTVIEYYCSNDQLQVGGSRCVGVCVDGYCSQSAYDCPQMECSRCMSMGNCTREFCLSLGNCVFTQTSLEGGQCTDAPIAPSPDPVETTVTFYPLHNVFRNMFGQMETRNITGVKVSVYSEDNPNILVGECTNTGAKCSLVLETKKYYLAYVTPPDPAYICSGECPKRFTPDGNIVNLHTELAPNSCFYNCPDNEKQHFAFLVREKINDESSPVVGAKVKVMFGAQAAQIANCVTERYSSARARCSVSLCPHCQYYAEVEKEGYLSPSHSFWVEKDPPISLLPMPDKEVHFTLRNVGKEGREQVDCPSEYQCADALDLKGQCIEIETHYLGTDLDGDGDVDDYYSQYCLDAGGFSHNTCVKCINTPQLRRSPPCESYGDVNDDGYVDRMDVVKIEQHLSETLQLSQEEEKRADVNRDNKVSYYDIDLITRYIGDREASLPVCQVGQEINVEFKVADSAGSPLEGAQVSVYEQTGAGPMNCQASAAGSCALDLMKDFSYRVVASLEGFSPNERNFMALENEPVAIVLNVLSPKSLKPPCDNYGDIVMDGVINQLDYFEYVVRGSGGFDFSLEQKRRADVNGDGSIDVIDAMIVSDFLEGKINTFPVCHRELPPGTGKIILGRGYNIVSTDSSRGLRLGEIREQCPGIDERGFLKYYGKDSSGKDKWALSSSLAPGEAGFVYFKGAGCAIGKDEPKSSISSLALRKGWNLFSVPRAPSGGGSYCFEGPNCISIKGNCEIDPKVMYAYSGRTANVLKPYTLSGPLDPTKGYWVKVKQACSLKFQDHRERTSPPPM